MVNHDHINRHCQGANLYLVSNNLFQNNLFVASLKKIHKCQSTFAISTSLSEIPSDFGNASERKAIIFLDCFELSFERLETLLRFYRSKFSPNVLLALYNLDKVSFYEKKALSYGVCGFFYHNDKLEVFCQGTRRMLADGIWLSRALMPEVISSRSTTKAEECSEYQFMPHKLSVREMQVLSVLSSGISNKEIGNELCISVHTVRTHLYKIFKKINVNTRAQAILWCQKNLHVPCKLTDTTPKN